MKYTLLVLCLLTMVTSVSAGDMVCGNGTVTIFGAIEDTVLMGEPGDHNYNRTVCINASVIEGQISIQGDDNYELDYIFIADFNDTVFVTRILTVKQEKLSGGLISDTVCERTLSLDGIEIGQYEAVTPFWGRMKSNTIYYDVVDGNVRFGSELIEGAPLAFTQFNYVDQYNYLQNVTGYPKFPISHKYISVGDDRFNSELDLTGLTAVVYNVFGDSSVENIPIVGSAIVNFGRAIQGVIYLPLSVVQFSFDFIFTFLTLIKNNWWYAIMLLEIFCIFSALKYKTYTAMVETFIVTHVKIFTFMWEVVVLNMIKLIVRFIEVIRNLFRI